MMTPQERKLLFTLADFVRARISDIIGGKPPRVDELMAASRRIADAKTSVELHDKRQANILPSPPAVPPLAVPPLAVPPLASPPPANLRSGVPERPPNPIRNHEPKKRTKELAWSKPEAKAS